MDLRNGVLSQLAASAEQGTGGVTQLADGSSASSDTLRLGASLLSVLGELQQQDRPVLLMVDDVHWADRPSASALLFALRRLHADRVLALLSARPEQLGRLGEGWFRFAAGDRRVIRLTLPGWGPGDLVALCRASGIAHLSRHAITRLIEQTSGNPLYCSMLLNEFGSQAGFGEAWVGRVPRSLSDIIAVRAESLRPASHRLVVSAAVLGERCLLSHAAALAGLTDPLGALEEASDAGLLSEDRDTTTQVAFTHSMVRKAIYNNIAPSERRRLHNAAALLVGWEQGLLDQ